MSKEIRYTLIPRDLVFARDARPMEKNYMGFGGMLPNPMTWFGAIQTICKDNACEGAAEKTMGLPWPLQTKGVFLQMVSKEERKKGVVGGAQGKLVLPVPLDLIPPKENDSEKSLQTLQLKKLEQGCSDLPAPLKYGLFADRPTKEKVGEFIAWDEMVKYLQGKAPDKLVSVRELFEREMHTGIEIDSSKRSAKKGKYYTAEYIRLNEGVSLSASICFSEQMELLVNQGALRQMKDCFKLILGGQRCIFYADAEKAPWPWQGGKLCVEPQSVGKYVKWVLLTPAIWKQGWLPDFINEDGSLNLRSHDEAQTAQQPSVLPEDLSLLSSRERRKILRKPLQERYAQEGGKASFPGVRLIAARIGKPESVSGWRLDSERVGGPNHGMLCVPAGSVFYFETSGREESLKLMTELQRNPLSTFRTTAGYGIGLAGIYDIENNNL